MSEPLFTLDADNYRKCQQLFRGTHQREYYDGEFWVDDSLPVEVEARRRAIGPYTIIETSAATRQFFRRTRKHIREDATDLGVLWFVRRGSLVFSNQQGQRIVGEGEFLLTRSMAPFFIELQPGDAGSHEILHLTVPAHLLRKHMASQNGAGETGSGAYMPAHVREIEVAQAMAKNHGIVMPDADLDMVVNDLCGAAFGSAGERCMALPVVVPVGEDTAERLREKLIPAINALRVGVSTDPDAHYGPVVTPEHKARIEQWIQTAVDEGSELVIDGRGFTLQGHEKGFFVAPTLLDRVTTEMSSYKEEIFGPVLQMVRAKDFEEAVALPSKHQYGNGVAIFTRNGHAAREFAARVNVGMVGVNVPIPVPVSYHSFGGWKRSAFGDTNQYGMEGLRFWTKVKTVTQRWPDGGGDGSNAFLIPTL
jgi:hypothetical protein